MQTDDGGKTRGDRVGFKYFRMRPSFVFDRIPFQQLIPTLGIVKTPARSCMQLGFLQQARKMQASCRNSGLQSSLHGCNRIEVEVHTRGQLQIDSETHPIFLSSLFFPFIPIL